MPNHSSCMNGRRPTVGYQYSKTRLPIEGAELLPNCRHETAGSSICQQFCDEGLAADSTGAAAEQVLVAADCISPLDLTDALNHLECTHLHRLSTAKLDNWILSALFWAVGSKGYIFVLQGASVSMTGARCLDIQILDGVRPIWRRCSSS